METGPAPVLRTLLPTWVRLLPHGFGLERPRSMCAGLKARSSAQPKFTRNSKHRRAAVVCFRFIAQGRRYGPTLDWRSPSPWDCWASSIHIFFKSITQKSKSSKPGMNNTDCHRSLAFFHSRPRAADAQRAPLAFCRAQLFKFNPFGCIFPRIVLPGGLGGNEVKAMVEIFFEMKNRRKKSASSSNDAIARPQGIGSQSVGGFPFSPKHLGTVVGICLFLAALVWLVFGQPLGHEFVNYDDDLYLSENPTVIHGLNPAGVGWAFAHIVASNWHPVTMLSHMLDCQFYGLNSGGHHLTNVVLHLTVAILLFLVLREMTGALWRSAFVAAGFAIHPLRVESVAWGAERKDVLSGGVFLLTP